MIARPPFSRTPQPTPGNGRRKTVLRTLGALAGSALLSYGVKAVQKRRANRRAI